MIDTVGPLLETLLPLLSTAKTAPVFTVILVIVTVIVGEPVSGVRRQDSADADV